MLRADRGVRVTDSGHVLWRDLADAYRYAELRSMVYGGRQRVRVEVVLGVRFWRVTKSCRQVEVAEPCS